MTGPPYFPQNLEPDRHGLVAVGGRLDRDVLLEAYAKGIFPWEDNPVPFWFSPDPRMVLYPAEHRVPERLGRRIRRREMTVVFDTDFDAVISGCAETPRPGQGGTWISPAFRAAYTDLFHEGYVHCISVLRDGALVGGLYGVSLGRAFFGESMFSRATDASKVAVYYLVAWCRHMGMAFVDCQAPTPHLESLGARSVPRRRFLAELSEAMRGPTLRGSWTEASLSIASAR